MSFTTVSAVKTYFDSTLKFNIIEKTVENVRKRGNLLLIDTSKGKYINIIKENENI